LYVRSLNQPPQPPQVDLPHCFCCSPQRQAPPLELQGPQEFAKQSFFRTTYPQPYYRPISALDQGYTHPPFLLGADHVFEWRSTLHGFPLCIVTLSINPLYHFPHPHLVVANSFTYQCPHLHLLHWDLMPEIPLELSESLEQVNQYLDGDLTKLFVHLNQFHFNYFLPITPYD